MLGYQGLDALSGLVINVAMPLLIFSRIVRGFSFEQYPDWWVYPLVSLCITALGFFLGFLFSGLMKGTREKMQFIGLVSFQNSGYLALVLVASILPASQAATMFIYTFLFLVAFNLLMFSVGVYLLTYNKGKKFKWADFLNPPVVATLLGLMVVATKLNNSMPQVIIRPLELIGDCTVPLATLVVGGNIATIGFKAAKTGGIILMSLVKLVLMPAIGLWLVYRFKIGGLLGLLIILQLAMPPATNLSVIMRQYRQDDSLVSQGVFWGHILSIITIPVFLSLYFALGMLK